MLDVPHMHGQLNGVIDAQRLGQGKLKTNVPFLYVIMPIRVT